jgi:Arm domain-containing DNA-binding protein
VRAGKMTALKVAAIARAKVPGYYGDGGGLFLQISRFGTPCWVFRYRIGSRLREMGLGSLDTIGPADARERAARRANSGSTGSIRSNSARRRA